MWAKYWIDKDRVCANQKAAPARLKLYNSALVAWAALSYLDWECKEQAHFNFKL